MSCIILQQLSLFHYYIIEYTKGGYMWSDTETTKDLLNFKVVADSIANIIINSNNEPMSIGISGSWGVGKSSLVKMIGESIRNNDKNNEYIFIEFNAWLYQGYDDAKNALLQTVADNIIEISEKKQTCIDKTKKFIKRINWLQGIKFFALPVAELFFGGISGPIGIFIEKLNKLSSGDNITTDDIKNIKDAYGQLSPELKKIVDNEQKSIPKGISELRDLFKGILKELNIKLIVLVDDLDRCLPDTAISTLEAIRLLLFIPQTAFIIAADERMIRSAVRSHFSGIDLTDELVTNYFDKLIQIPITVPRIGINEAKGYLILLLSDLACRRGKITKDEYDLGYSEIITKIKQGWKAFTKKDIEIAYGKTANNIVMEIDIADQIASIMVTSKYIAGNPRLIKRFLNNLIIRESIASAQGMSFSFDLLVKMQLFERCATGKALEEFIENVIDSQDGKPEFIAKTEKEIEEGKKEFLAIPESWKNDKFILEWLELKPMLTGIDLRPLMYLSRNKIIKTHHFDELSTLGNEIYQQILATDRINIALVEKIKQLDFLDAERVFYRLNRHIKNEQWAHKLIVGSLNIIESFPELKTDFIAMLQEIPASKRVASLIPILTRHSYFNELLLSWSNDPETPKPTIKSIQTKLK